jgi:pyruvate dehydrogenase (quinone)
MKTVADQFAETVAAAGVKRICGIVGANLNGLTDALQRQGKIEWVHVRHSTLTASFDRLSFCKNRPVSASSR